MKLRNLLLLVFCCAPMSIISQELVADASTSDLKIILDELENTSNKSDYSKKRVINKAANKKNKELHLIKKETILKEKLRLKYKKIAEKDKKNQVLYATKEAKIIAKQEKDIINKNELKLQKEIADEKIAAKINYKNKLSLDKALLRTQEKEQKVIFVKTKRANTLAKKLKIKEDRLSLKKEFFKSKTVRRKVIQLKVKHIALKRIETKRVQFNTKKELALLRKKQFNYRKELALKSRIIAKKDKKTLDKTTPTDTLVKKKLFNGSVTRVENN